MEIRYGTTVSALTTVSYDGNVFKREREGRKKEEAIKLKSSIRLSLPLLPAAACRKNKRAKKKERK